MAEVLLQEQWRNHAIKQKRLVSFTDNTSCVAPLSIGLTAARHPDITAVGSRRNSTRVGWNHAQRAEAAAVLEDTPDSKMAGFTLRLGEIIP
jgi:hypothetical protein